MDKRNSASILDQRKKDHIDLALASQISAATADKRFYYEPILSAFPLESASFPTTIAGKKLNYPIWISSMTGGTSFAGLINQRLAKVCKEFGLGMGLGSCRIILDNNQYLKDFSVRKYIGEEAPLFANLGIAQVEAVNRKGNWEVIHLLLKKLNADGLIIHVNPLQEWLQPEGDKIIIPPLETIQAALINVGAPIIVKEVGQGMGPKSIDALLRLPLEAIEFAALGGTNFSNLEIKRNDKSVATGDFNVISTIGHTADEMIDFVNGAGSALKSKMKCKKFIISGGVKDFLDGYYFTQKLKYDALYGQASRFLGPAKKDYNTLYQFVRTQVAGLQLAYQYLSVR
ncbi:MAG: isopentenyl-diphosphate delta-isomerase [Saprospiraceae bacterium]